jgi:hypothetical protein
MKRSALGLLLFAPLAFAAAMNACTSGNSPVSTPGTDAATSQEDSALPGFDSSVLPEASADSAPPRDAGVDAPADGQVDAPTDAGPLTCSEFDASVEYDAAGLDAAPSINSDAAGPTLPGPSPASCSLLGDTHAPFEVINNSPCPIDVWWVGYDCEEYYFGSAAPNGGTFVNDTWETAPWRLRLQGSEVLVSELPALPEGAPDAALRVFTYP